MNRISVISLDDKYRFCEQKIKRITRKFFRLLKKDNCSVDFFLITGSKMKFLNKKFRNKNKTTDILTFVEPENFPHPESKLKFLGEIYLNPDCISRNEFAPMIAHGLLHLFGFQHQEKGDSIKMEAREKFLISNL
ncbi:rRNA maturation RNase YbeY [Candidatus Jorgensenbacteria bacterium RIFCSPLOWO2_12_FULL_42_11]|uniref:Endoribonuclease YbeY n=1 Tax=Candidatus Jorgensenbacteria bacterium RIFCSPLOWO2_12_FULL_42_11 TaxID=1798473 RepID=A0A1F6C3U1_9BACT|nr:MAG: rRNA maturation RNase YbeY [Candidatus Jorgensenbacteria bacterium RIFCSPLOWO2_12_FULL_42_11]